MSAVSFLFSRRFLGILSVAGAFAFACPLAHAATPGSAASTDFEAIDSDSGRKLKFSDLASKEQMLLATSILPDSEIAKLNRIFREHGPAAAIASIEKLPNDPKLLLWLEARSREGHILPMWELSNRLAIIKPYESMVWLFSGLIGIWRESPICVQQPQRIVAQLSEKYQSAQNVSRVNPGKVKAATAEALARIEAIQPFPSPEIWLCRAYYPVPKGATIAPGTSVVYEEKHWDYLRKKEADSIRKRLGLSEGASASFALPESSFSAPPKKFTP